MLYFLPSAERKGRRGLAYVLDLPPVEVPLGKLCDDIVGYLRANFPEE